MSTSPAADFSLGLAGVVAGETSICAIENDALLYRGYNVADLSEHATFEETAWLLLNGEKPTAAELAGFKAQLKEYRSLPAPAVALIKQLGAVPGVVPMDVLRTVVSFLSHYDPEAQDLSREAEFRKAVRLTSQIATIIGHLQNVIDGRDLIEPDASLDHAANLFYLITGRRPTAEEEKIFDVSLILYCEHEFNASTFTSRVIAGTLADLHGAVTGGIAALKGPLHGGANEAAIDMLKEIGDIANVDAFMAEAFRTKRKIMGFGHRVYKHGDHRAKILHKLGRAYAEKIGSHALRWFELGEKVQGIMEGEKKIFPNVDFPCGLIYFVMGIPIPQYTPIFVAARIIGWSAHVIEQHGNNKLIRPLAKYTGYAPRKW